MLLPKPPGSFKEILWKKKLCELPKKKKKKTYSGILKTQL